MGGGAVMRLIAIVGIAACVLPLAAGAHICNDVFVQARDNLVVKVDVRDGQLRINESGKFRVYLLNTMIGNIESIMLDVKSEDFDATVKPSPDWSEHPKLLCLGRGGRKVYYEVELTRKEGTPEGRYEIDLVLYGGKKRLIFRTIDVEEGVGLMELPRAAPSIEIDGSPKSSEWRSAFLCTSFTEFKRVGKFREGFPAGLQTRIRLSHDVKNLYCAVDIQEKRDRDVVRLYFAKDTEDTAKVLKVDLDRKTVSFSGGSEGLEFKFDDGRTKAEVKLPIGFLGFKKDAPKLVLINATRWGGKLRTYWKGNSSTVRKPVAYGTFILRED
jgi:hypothetical protein